MCMYVFTHDGVMKISQLRDYGKWLKLGTFQHLVYVRASFNRIQVIYIFLLVKSRVFCLCDDFMDSLYNNQTKKIKKRKKMYFVQTYIGNIFKCVSWFVTYSFLIFLTDGISISNISNISKIQFKNFTELLIIFKKYFL